MKSWDRQEGEPETAYSHFLAFLTLGVGRSIVRAYRATHPESTASAVSGVWREESSRWSWRKRANDFDLSLFKDTSREMVAVFGETIRHLARKTLRAMRSKKVSMRLSSWDQALDAFAVLKSLLPAEMIAALVDQAERQGDSPSAGKGKVAEGEPLEDLTDFHPRERWVDPSAGQTPPSPTPPA